MPGTDTTFNISGKVKDNLGVALANRPCKAQLDYHTYVNGTSVPSSPVYGFTTDANGNYSFTWQSVGHPVIAYDTAWGFNVTVGANDNVYLTTTAGQYSGNPTASPATIGVSDTVLTLNPNPPGG